MPLQASACRSREGAYRLNTEAGVALDVTEFDAAAETGDQLALAGDLPGSIDRYQGALDLYGGDLAFGSDVKHIVERERLRSRHLAVLARLAKSLRRWQLCPRPGGRTPAARPGSSAAKTHIGWRCVVSSA